MRCRHRSIFQTNRRIFLEHRNQLCKRDRDDCLAGNCASLFANLPLLVLYSSTGAACCGNYSCTTHRWCLFSNSPAYFDYLGRIESNCRMLKSLNHPMSVRTAPSGRSTFVEGILAHFGEFALF